MRQLCIRKHVCSSYVQILLGLIKVEYGKSKYWGLKIRGSAWMYLFVHPFCGDWLSSYTFGSFGPKCSFMHRKSSNLKQTNLNLQVKPKRHQSYFNTNCMGFNNIIPECDFSVAYKKIFHIYLYLLARLGFLCCIYPWRHVQRSHTSLRTFVFKPNIVCRALSKLIIA